MLMNTSPIQYSKRITSLYSRGIASLAAMPSAGEENGRHATRYLYLEGINFGSDSDLAYNGECGCSHL